MTSSPLQNHLFIVLLLALMTGFGISGCDLFTNNSNEEEGEIERSYLKSIERVYANEFERVLIDSAEAVYPPRDSLLALIPPERWHLVPDTMYWYFSSLDGVLTPYVLTNEAIIYYSTLIDSLKAGQHQHIVEAEFEYRANISFSENYEFKWPEWPEALMDEAIPVLPDEILFNVYVVEMAMLCDHATIEQSGSSYAHGRVVLFDNSGKLVWFIDSFLPVTRR